MKGWKRFLVSSSLALFLPLSISHAQRPISDPASKFLHHMRNANGKAAFSSEEMNMLIITSADKEALSFFNKDGSTKYRTQDILRYASLGVYEAEVESFRNTPKPNAVLLFPEEEKVVPGEARAFYIPDTRRIINRLRESYDLYVRIIDRKEKIDSALTKVPNTELLVIGGHGDPSGLRLDVKTLNLEEMTQALEALENPGHYLTKGILENPILNRITVSDGEVLARYFRKLAPNATIFLSSCETAKPVNFGVNFASVVRKASGYRRVIAAKESFAISEVELDPDRIYPLSLNIIIEENGRRKDVTYIGKTMEEMVKENQRSKVSVLETKALKAISPIKKN